MTVEQIKETILQTAGNPESGAIFELADALAEAICDLVCAKTQKPSN